jgi:cytochrome c553
MELRCFHQGRGKLAASMCILLVLAGSRSWGAEIPRGEQVYQTLCVKCHGPAGEGTKKHADRLTGEKSLAELAKYIEKSMPEDEPGKCTSEDAQQVAAYIYDAFYSPIAQARLRPARIELARLTVVQYQNALADLIGSFRGETIWGNERGLHGVYFRSRNLRHEDRLIDRTDSMVSFDFGDSAPEFVALEETKQENKFDAQQFSIRWEGALLAPDTGEYDFIVHTDHAARLWINDLREPLVDAWVKSGDATEFRASLHLLGGRVYPLRLEFSKAKQGVDDSEKTKGKVPNVAASISLNWRRPHLADELIPSRYLSPKQSPEVFVFQTPFPPDDRSAGYERGTSISNRWDEATTDAAIETADYVAARLNELADIKDSTLDRQTKLKQFCQRFAERAFRRQLSAEQKTRYIDHQLEASWDNSEAAVKRIVLLVLKSPRFLYREVAPDDHDQQFDVAARISFGLWDSLPDKRLAQAAQTGRLANIEQIREQTDRMLPDLRTHAKLRQFFLQWLKVDEVRDLSKDAKEYPDFTPTIAADLRSSLEQFIDEIVWSESSDFREIFTSKNIPLNRALAKFYCVDVLGGVGFDDVPMEPDHRAGVLTHPYLLATFAHASTSSPIHRGVFISRNLLGRALKPPPEAMTPLAPAQHPDMTTRERIALQTQSDSCMVCHETINPLGFALENFDAVGRFRREEQGKPIDSSGAYQTRSGQVEKFNGVRELANFLASSDEVYSAFIEQLFHHLIKQPVQAYGPHRLDELLASFKQNGYNIRKLAIEIVAGAAMPPKVEHRSESSP